jgi:hypothetical protein
MFPKAKFDVALQPPDADQNCGAKHFCFSEDIRPVPGTPSFRTSEKGRAEVTFAVPATYEIFNINFKDPTKIGEFPVPFVNGQVVQVGAGILRIRHHRYEAASADASGVVAVPSS